MENASKALIMAASVLLGIMILSLAVYLFATFGATSAQIHEQNEASKLNEFNTQFTSYEGKRNTIYDVITVANLATTNNEQYELTKASAGDKESFYVQVYLSNGKGTSKTIEGAFEDVSRTNYNKIIKADTENMRVGTNGQLELDTYKCEVSISDITERVYSVVFTVVR